MAEIPTTTTPTESITAAPSVRRPLPVEGLTPYDAGNPAHNQEPLTLIPGPDGPVTVRPMQERAGHAANQPAVTAAESLLQVENEVSRRMKELQWWQKPFAEQMKPFIRAEVKKQLRVETAGTLSTSSFADEAVRIVGDSNQNDEVASSRRRVGQPESETPALREASGTRAVVKAALHEYVKKGTAVTSLAAAGLMFVPGGQLIGGAAITAHGVAKLKTSVHDAGARAQEHLAQAHIRLQATGTAGEDMSALARIKQNIAWAHQLPTATIKEIGMKALAYAGAVLSPLGEEHQIARAGARGFSRMLSADELLASRQEVLATADVTTLVATSERIGQSLARGYVRNMRRARELEAYKDELDAQVVCRASHADEISSARREQSGAIAAELDERARADVKWAARHELSHKVAYGALASVAAVRMIAESALLVQGFSSVMGVPNPTSIEAHAASLHSVSHNIGLQSAQSAGQEHALTAAPKGPALVNEGITSGHSQDFAIDVTPDGKGIRMFSLDHTGNAVTLQDGGHTYLIPFDKQGQLVLGHNGTVDAITENGTHVQLQQDDVLRYLGIDDHVQKGLQQDGGILETSGYRLSSRVAEVQYDAHNGQYHLLASTGGQAGGTLEPHSDHLSTITQQSSTSAGASSHPANLPAQSSTPSPTPTPSATPTVGPKLGPYVPSTPTPSVLPSYPEQSGSFNFNPLPAVLGLVVLAVGYGALFLRSRSDHTERTTRLKRPSRNQPPIEIVRTSTPRPSTLTQEGQSTTMGHQKMHSSLVPAPDALQKKEPVVPSAASAPADIGPKPVTGEQQKAPGGVLVLDEEMEAVSADGKIALSRTNVLANGKPEESLVVFASNPDDVGDMTSTGLRDKIAGLYRNVRTVQPFWTVDQVLEHTLAQALKDYAYIAKGSNKRQRPTNQPPFLAGAMVSQPNGSYILGTIPFNPKVWPQIEKRSDASGHLKWSEGTGDVEINLGNGLQVTIPSSAPLTSASPIQSKASVLPEEKAVHGTLSHSSTSAPNAANVEAAVREGLRHSERRKQIAKSLGRHGTMDARRNRLIAEQRTNRLRGRATPFPGGELAEDGRSHLGVPSTGAILPDPFVDGSQDADEER